MVSKCKTQTEAGKSRGRRTVIVCIPKLDPELRKPSVEQTGKFSEETDGKNLGRGNGVSITVYVI